MEQCLAITNKSTRCKLITKNEYCYCHYYSYAIYKNDDEWPTMAQVRKSIKKVDNLYELLQFITTLKFFGTNLEIRKTIVIVAESLIKYRILYFDENVYLGWKKAITLVVSKLEPFDHLETYLLNFRKKVDKDFRLNAQKKYIHFCISHSELGKDIADVVCKYL